MSAAASRERRATAGRRMTSLVGKALEDDEAFWGHDTWASESDNESFRESDEASEDRVDVFDSDFDESESDHEEEEEAAGRDEELELQREERKANRKKQRFDIAKAGRELMKKKKGRGRKRALGEGINAGLVLNLPGSGLAAPVPPPAPVSAAAPAAPASPAAAETVRKSRRQSPARTSARRSLRAATHHKTQEAEMRRKATASAAPAAAAAVAAANKKKQRKFTQEELLLEAATVTEPENERWLLARKRIQESADESHKLAESEVRGNVVSRFYSRRGCLNTITFLDMDRVPDILSRRESSSQKAASKAASELCCVITGKKARYRDPKTMLGYYDTDAFRELRRRLDNGEPLDQQVKEDGGEKEDDKQASTTPVCDLDNVIQSTARGKDTKIDAIAETNGLDSGPTMNGNEKPVSVAKTPSSIVKGATDELKSDSNTPAPTANEAASGPDTGPDSKPLAKEPQAPLTPQATVSSGSPMRPPSRRKRTPSAKVRAAKESGTPSGGSQALPTATDGSNKLFGDAEKSCNISRQLPA